MGDLLDGVCENVGPDILIRSNLRPPPRGRRRCQGALARPELQRQAQSLIGILLHKEAPWRELGDSYRGVFKRPTYVSAQEVERKELRVNFFNTLQGLKRRSADSPVFCRSCLRLAARHRAMS